MPIDRRRFLAATAGATVLSGTSFRADAQAQADHLRIGLASEPSSVDPHFHNLTPNNALARHFFGTLVEQDHEQKLRPGLAESWRAESETSWIFNLRRGVTWHDGSPFTADDVLYTFSRAPNVPRSPSGFGGFLRGRTAEKVDNHTLRIRTQGPDPLLTNHLSSVCIIKASLGPNVTTDDFNSGRAAIGTGPYRLVEFVPGSRVVAQRNDAFWGQREPWSRVTFSFLRADPSRVSALLAGDVDVIEVVPTADVARIRQDQRLTVASGLSARVIYFHMDQFRDNSPFIRDTNGQPMNRNPLKDLRVRQALSIGLNRQAIVERVMEGEAQAAGQLLAPGFFGTSPNLPVPEFNPNRARQLLAEAGYPNGFRMTMHGPIGRYTNDTKIIEAAAQMYARIGIQATVETIPQAAFFSRASTGANGEPEFSFILVGWGASTGETSESLRGLVATFNRETGMGAANRGRYSNPQVDRLLEQAFRTVNDEAREQLLRQGMEVAVRDLGVIPIHYPLNTWAGRRGLRLQSRTDEYTLAMSVRPT
jgi:peptide/nickel transport system substrate-binding protein